MFDPSAQIALQDHGSWNTAKKSVQAVLLRSNVGCRKRIEIHTLFVCSPQSFDRMKGLLTLPPRIGSADHTLALIATFFFGHLPKTHVLRNFMV